MSETEYLCQNRRFRQILAILTSVGIHKDFAYQTPPNWSQKTDEFLDEFIFKGKVKGGFFVEAGADNFLLNTNSLLFERQHGWTGLLVEPIIGRFYSG